MPAQLTNGSIAYLVITLAAIAVVKLMAGCGYVQKNTASIAFPTIVIMGISTWMMWACAFLHQWHPLIVPEYKTD